MATCLLLLLVVVLNIQYISHIFVRYMTNICQIKDRYLYMALQIFLYGNNQYLLLYLYSLLQNKNQKKQYSLIRHLHIQHIPQMVCL